MNDNIYNIIIRPLVTEKGTYQSETLNAYAFQVAPTANKAQIKQAVEKIYNVKVVDVRTANRKGKPRRTGHKWGSTSHWKKAKPILSIGTVNAGMLPRPFRLVLSPIVFNMESGVMHLHRLMIHSLAEITPGYGGTNALSASPKVNVPTLMLSQNSGGTRWPTALSVTGPLQRPTDRL